MRRIFLLAAIVLGASSAARAEVVVLANRSAAKVNCVVKTDLASDDKPRLFPLEAGEVKPLRVSGRAMLAIGTSKAPQRYTLDPNSAYYFAENSAGKISLERIGLGNSPPDKAEVPTADSAQPMSKKPADTEPTVITVKILVDEDENAVQAVWEKRLRARVEAASKILEESAFVHFKVVAVGTWKSDNAVNDFPKSLTEFEQQVDPAPARLAIGFTSQYQLVRGRTHLGGTHGPLKPHLMLREWSQHVSEPERLELLLHELGHFLGAVHSPEQTSVMRPVLGDRVARATSFRIGYDPINTLAMCLVGEDLRQRPLTELAECSVATRVELRLIYGDLAKSMPNDPTAARYLSLLQPNLVVPQLPIGGR